MCSQIINIVVAFAAIGLFSLGGALVLSGMMRGWLAASAGSRSQFKQGERQMFQGLALLGALALLLMFAQHMH